MGASPTIPNGPSMCFNSAKSWSLGWYHNAHKVLNAEEISDNVYHISSIVDYNQISNNYIIIKITQCANKFDYFINFNREVGITADNSEGHNMVLVTKTASSHYADSLLVARLQRDEEYIAKALKSGNFIAINVKSLSTDASPPFASVRVYVYLFFTCSLFQFNLNFI